MVVRKTSPSLVIIPSISTSACVGVVYPPELIIVLAPIAMSLLIVGGLVVVWSIVIVAPLVMCVPLVSTWSGVVKISSVHMIATSILAWSLLVLEPWRIVEIPSRIGSVIVICRVDISGSSPIIYLSRTLAVPLVIPLSFMIL